MGRKSHIQHTTHNKNVQKLMMQVKVIMRETIKPSSPTPRHKNSFKLSLIDKTMTPIYIKFITYYSPAQTKNFRNLDQTLKESLSKALTIFYPFAGRINDDTTIDCNDNGVLFITTSVDCELVDLLSSPKPRIESFEKFLPPIPPFCPDESDRPSLLAYQFNKFTCGGIGITFCFHHLLIDAITNAAFIKCWSEISAKAQNATNYTICPAVSMFPEGSTEELPGTLLRTIGNMLARDERGPTKRFNFENWAILKIKKNSASEHVPIPTRVEALTSFLWKHMAAAFEVVRGYTQPSVLIQAVDIRRRMPSGIPPTVLPVGNMVLATVAQYRQTTVTTKDVDVEKELVPLVRQSINKIKDDIIPKLFSNGAYDTVRKSLEGLEETLSDGNLNVFEVSSWQKIGLADINFGWGKPIWVSLMEGAVNSIGSNLVILIDGGNDNIEAWVTLGEKKMEALENNHEFLAFASPNPPILFDSVSI